MAMRRTILAFVALLLSATLAWAQAGRGTISGVVIDPSGAVVPGTEVIAVHQGTNIATTTVSNEQGLYSLLNLAVGTYTITFKKEGFADYVREGVSVGTADALTVDAFLGVAGLSDAVTVKGDASALQLRNAEIGTALESDIVTDLPLTMTGGRALERFAYALTPSVEGNDWESNIAGAPPFSKEVVIDGSSAVIQIAGHIGETSPSMEAVEEFKVQTSGISAEYGRTGGGIFNFSLKSGTNDLSGSAFGYMRNEAFNANTWQNNALKAQFPERAHEFEKARDRQYLGGFSLGGPILKNRTFYFTAFEEYQQSRFLLGALDRTVPVPEFLNGDFGRLLDRSVVLGTDAAGNPIYRGAILDPQTGLVFPDNKIPANRISRVAQQIVEIYRKSYSPTVDRLINNNAATFYNDPDFKQHQWSVKIDHAMSPSSRLSGSLIWNKRPRTLTDQGGIWDASDEMGGPLSRARRHIVSSYQGRLSHNLVISPTVMHTATLTYNRFHQVNVAGASDGDWSNRLGFGNIGSGNFPEINFGDAVNGVGMTQIGYNQGGGYVTNVYQLNDSLSWVKGRHVMKFGGDLRFMQMNSIGAPPTLTFNFSNIQTGVPNMPWSNQVGFGFASFLLGEVESATRNVNQNFYGRRNYLALFAQDDIRLNDRMTLNVGLRWETTGPWHEKYNSWANFNTKKINPTLGIPGVLEFADEAEGNTFEGDRDWTEFGPRIGFTYQLNDRTVLRSAYGIFYAPIGINYWAGVPYGFAPHTKGVDRIERTDSGAPAFNWDNGYPGTFQPGNKDRNYLAWGMVSVSDESLKAGRTQQWNAGIDFELTPDLVIGANYMGNYADRLQSGDFGRNQPDLGKLSALLKSGKEWNWVSDEASAAEAGVPYPYPGFAGNAFMALAPYPQVATTWGPLFYVGLPYGESRYHAVQLTATKRMSHGIAANASYVLSRAESNTDSNWQERWWVGPLQDVTALDMEAGVIDNNDRTHVFKGYFAWELPFGNGRRFLTNLSGWKDALIGGWTLSTMFRYQSGTPLWMSSSNWYAGWSTYGYPIYMNVKPGADLKVTFDPSRFDATNPAAPGNAYFDKNAVANPEYGEFGTHPIKWEEIRQPSGAYEDLGIMKYVRLGGKYRLQIRFEMLNIFNRHYFASPVTDPNSPYFGQVISTTGEPRQGQLGVRFEW